MGLHNRQPSSDSDTSAMSEVDLHNAANQIDAEASCISETLTSTAPQSKIEWLWGRQVLDRAVRTAAQSALAWFALNSAPTLSSALTLLGVVGASAFLSVLTSFASAPSFDNSWWFQVLERAVKTFAQNIVAGWTVVATVDYLHGFPPDLGAIVSSAAVATVTSLITSVITTNMGKPGVVDFTTL